MLDKYLRLFLSFKTFGKLLNNNLKEFSEKILDIFVDFRLNILSIDLIKAPKLEFKITLRGELIITLGSNTDKIG